uniref:EF-hand domain-containing protein n=1 Tax=Strombidium inclinatum TaxID=197538 RepID=A0A7S3IF60_9SPIT|mmetsp:Transcript_15412/g.23706  ORF Transcript_15412/g.23706 Transcript_15412/m.23706 type:complete len:215 (+) Transcript_15412:1-645(+)
MKFTLATLALLGLVSAKDTTTVWSLQSVQDHRDDAAFQHTFGDSATAAANARPPYRSHVQEESSDDDSSSSDEDLQLRGDDEEEEDHSKEFYKAFESGRLDGKYERVIPDIYAADTDDLFMRSMLKNYALEGKNKDGSPNGNFVIDEVSARSAAREVLGTHKGLHGAAMIKYMQTYFEPTWKHFDVNGSGKIEVLKMPQFMRFLTSDQSLDLGH